MERENHNTIYTDSDLLKLDPTSSLLSMLLPRVFGAGKTGSLDGERSRPRRGSYT